ncbi:MAG: DUF456 domain-containing protein [Janthinobacterium lividum]
MGDAGLVVVGLAIAVGLVGIVVPLLPGTIIIALAVLAWALSTGGAAWAFFAGAVVLLAAGQVCMIVLPGRRMTRAGIPRWTLLLGAALAVVGFFVVPVVGLPLGFVLGIFLAELVRATRTRQGAGAAWASSVTALKGVGLSVALEGGAGILAALCWGVGALVLR